MTNDSREAFESEFEYLGKYLFRRKSDGDYVEDLIQTLWIGYNFGRAHIAKELEGVLKVLYVLSRTPLATFYKRDKGGYYAGCDDIEYSVKQALATLNNILKGE